MKILKTTHYEKTKNPNAEGKKSGELALEPLVLDIDTMLKRIS